VLAEDIIHVPQKEPGEEDKKTLRQENTYYVSITPSPFYSYIADKVLRTGQSQSPHLTHVFITLCRIPFAQSGPQVMFHDVEALEYRSCRQKTVGDLMEDGVLGMEIIDLVSLSVVSIEFKRKEIYNVP
jgi:hypothetical protein